ELIRQITDKAIIREHLSLSSGLEVDYYLDMRRIALSAAGGPLVGAVMLDMLADVGLADVEAVGGLTMGADPVRNAVLHQSVARGTPIDAFVVRKTAKSHGLTRRVEGPDVAGRRVVAVEDTSTTGGSVLTAVEALEEAGAHVAAVAVVVDRDTGARERVEEAGYRYYAALELTDRKSTRLNSSHDSISY